MASSRLPWLLVTFLLVVSACSNGHETGTPEITRLLLPPTPTWATTTTTTQAVDPLEADFLAQTELRAVLAAARELWAARGTFDATPDEVAVLAAPADVIILEDAALRPGVVYDPHGQRVTLHRQSLSGRWFCVDVSPQGDDFGFGDSFESSLTACTDGILASGWGNVLSPTGLDESAIEATLGALAAALALGDARAAHAVFDPESACPLADLLEAWPSGVALAEFDGVEIQSVSISGDQAAVEAEYPPFPQTVWELARRAETWRLVADPCELLETNLSERTSVAARDLLERGLFAVRSTFVVQQNFAFSERTLAEFDETLLFVPSSDIGFGTLAYTGTESRGLLTTVASTGTFFCAVESLSAETVYGTGATIDEVKTADRCISKAGS